MKRKQRKVKDVGRWLVEHPCEIDPCYQVSPLRDSKHHVTNRGGDCWCEPDIELRFGSRLVLHNAKDGRQ